MAENTQEQQSETTCITDTQVSQINESLILIREKCQNLYDVVSHLDQDWLLIAQPRLNSLLQIPEHSAETLAIVRKLGNWPNEYADIKVKIERLSTDALNISKSLSAENQLHEKQIQSLALLDTRLKDLGASFEQWKANSQAKHTEHEQALRLIDSVNQSTAGEISTIRESLRQGHESLHLAIKDIEKQADRTRSVLMETLRDVQQRFDKQSLSIQQLHDAMNAMSRGIEQSTHQNDASHRETRDRLSELQQTISPVAVISNQLSGLPVQVAGLDKSIQAYVSRLKADVDTSLQRELLLRVEDINAKIVASGINTEKELTAKMADFSGGISEKIENNLKTRLDTFIDVFDKMEIRLKNDFVRVSSGVESKIDEKFKAKIRSPVFEFTWEGSKTVLVLLLPLVLAGLAVWGVLYMHNELNVNLTKQNGEKWQQEINRQADKEKALNEREHSCREDYYKEKERANRLEFELSSLRNKQREQKPLSGPVRSGPVPASPVVKSDGRGGSMTFSGTLHLAPAASPARQDAPATGEGTSSTPSVPGKPVKPAAPSGKTGT